MELKDADPRKVGDQEPYTTPDGRILKQISVSKLWNTCLKRVVKQMNDAQLDLEHADDDLLPPPSCRRSYGSAQKQNMREK